MKLALAVALVAFVGLGGCASPGVEQYRAEKPALDIRNYLNGTLDAWGIVQGRSGQVNKRFHVVIEATWAGDTGTLDEKFSWSDGSTSQRTWTIKRQPDGTYRGTAADVIGEATGEAAGNALRWRYVLAVPVDGRTYHLDLDDWMFLMNDKVMINRTSMSKWGFRVGAVTLTFVKR